MNAPFSYKVILLGNPGVGKTTLFRKLKCQGNIDKTESETDSLNLTPCVLDFTFKRSVRIQLKVNDTNSTERYRSSVPTNYFRHSHGVVLVYDVNNPASLYDLDEWMTDAYNKTAEDSSITYILVGMKRSRAGIKAKEMDTSDVKNFCERHGIPGNHHFTTSGTSSSLMDIFRTLAQSIHIAQSGEEDWMTSRSCHGERTHLLTAESKPPKTPCFKC